METQPHPQGIPTEPKTSGLAVASFIMAFLPLLNCIGFILAIVALVQIKNPSNRLKGSGLAIGGLVISMVIWPPILALAGVFLPKLAQAKARANRIKCVNNLSNIGKATLGFSQDNGSRTPWNLTPDQNRLHYGTERPILYPTEVFPGTAGEIFGLAAMKSEVQTAKILVSPCDAARMADNETLQAEWANIDTKGGNPVTAGTSYIFCQGGDFQRPATVVSLTRNLASDNIAAGNWSGADESPTPTNAMTGLNKSQGQLVRADGSASQSTDADLGASGKVVKGHINARGGTSRLGASNTTVIR